MKWLILAGLVQRGQDGQVILNFTGENRDCGDCLYTSATGLNRGLRGWRGYRSDWSGTIAVLATLNWGEVGVLRGEYGRQHGVIPDS